MAGEEGAFDALVGPLINAAYQLAVTMLSDREEARDAVQEASLKCWKRLGQLQSGLPIRPWFLAIVANQCRSVRRSRWWRVVKMAAPPVPPAGQEDRLIRGIDLDRALHRLRANDRVALFLYFFLDMPVEQVAAVLGLSIPATKARIYRALHKLRPDLQVEEVIP